MKSLAKFFLIASAVFTAVIGALVVLDKCLNKNRLAGEYLDCDTVEEDEEE